MEGLTAVVAGLIASLRAALGSEVCPGDWAWAVSLFGVALGLLPAVGAFVVALVRKRIGSRYGTGESVLLACTGVLFAGLLPLLAFAAAGQVFRNAVLPDEISGLTGRQLRDLGSAVCFVGPQSEFLGAGDVATAFSPVNPLTFGFALVTLAGFPLVAAMLVAAQARIALRRGPSWPSRFFWLPTLSIALLTAAQPAGTMGHLWIGFASGAFLGMFLVLMAGAPSREVVHRSLTASARVARPDPVRRPPTGPIAAQRPRQRLADRLAERFAARQPEPPVVPAPRSAPLDRGPHGPVGPRPTLMASVPPFPVPPQMSPAAAPPLDGAGGSPGAPRFRLVRRLGSGGFGRVWLAHDARLGHPVALKAAHAPDHETEERIRREARALAAVHHPHCVRIHDLVPAASDPGLSELEGMVIVMEYVEGSSLGDLVRARGTVDDIVAARVWASLAGALDAAHTQGVMHRDVKPGNVVVDQGGIAHLIDFGIARRTGDATMTMAGFVLGTPDFLAPEVACGERATPASDAWQLAATVSYALTGQPPRGGHPDAVSGLRAAATGAPLTQLPKRSAHVALLHAAMDNDPRRRPPLRTVQQALEDWLRRTGARPDGPVTAGTRGR
ncbi:serine/threonine-protein kinase [Pseudonocardia aurantiaca]|uniref:non-specific serine/threonine protein kinase n=1 Tax=Pseudonocardia aurantiaca TaxID=75290 RepID=A0ABW4FGT8_9PSEU